MNVWTNIEFIGYYPVGSAVVVVANTAQAAAKMLNGKLLELGLKETATAEQFQLLPTKRESVVILNDGNY